MAITSSLDVSSLRRQARVKYWHGEICRCAWKLQDDNVLMCFRNFSISRLPSRPHSAAKRRRSVVTLFAAVWKRALLVALWRIYMLRIPECERRWEKRRDKREKIRGVARKGFLRRRAVEGMVAPRSFPSSAVVSISAERFTALHPRTPCRATGKSPRDTESSLQSNWIPAGRQWRGKRGVLKYDVAPFRRRPFTARTCILREILWMRQVRLYPKYSN